VTFDLDDWKDLPAAKGKLEGVWRPKELD